MKVKMIVQRTAEKRTSTKSGKDYAVQMVGIELPEAPFPVGKEIFVKLENGQPKGFAPGVYDIEAHPTDDRNSADVYLRLDTRNPVVVRADVKKAA